MENTPATTFADRFTDLFAVLCLILIISGMGAIAIDSIDNNRSPLKIESEARATYQVWVKLTNRHDITYEDWRLAKKHGLLPAQTQAESK